MDPQSIILIALFVIGYTCIAFEHTLHINKSWVAVMTGSLMWCVVAWGQDAHAIHEMLIEETSEIFGLVIFLLGAMTIVEMLGHFRLFTWIENELLKRNISNRKLFWILGAITFFGSAVLDNLTITLIMIQIGKRLYLRKENFNIFVINTIIAANAGGAFSPVGDVTTIMIWIAGRFSAFEVILQGFLPSLVAWCIPQAILTSRIAFEEREGREVHDHIEVHWKLVALGMLSFVFAVCANFLHLPPFIGILLGLGVTGIVIDVRSRGGDLHRKAGRIVNLIQKADITTLKFFIGILLAVGALNFQGVLGQLTDVMFGKELNENAIIIGHTAVGLFSSILDNVPLTAAIIKMLPASVDQSLWVLLAITAGTGGSILVIGSAPGVAAMGQVPSLTFSTYLRHGSLAALLGYFGAVGTWLLMNWLV